MRKIAGLYTFDLAQSAGAHSSLLLCVERRELEQALEEVGAYYTAHPTPLLNLVALGEKSRIQVLGGDPEGAAKSLEMARSILERSEAVPPYYKSSVVRSRLLQPG